MKVYSIFDDFGKEAMRTLIQAGIDLTVHPLGMSRPDNKGMKRILEEYDCVIIGTSQIINEDMFENILTPRIIATASAGVDHIRIPEEKRSQIKVINTPKANVQSVSEYIIACALICCKRLWEGIDLYSKAQNNKELSSKPEEIYGKTIGLIGAGKISERIIGYAHSYGMNILCWTAHPDKHVEFLNCDVRFVTLETLVSEADIISVNLPNNKGTMGIISESLVGRMKENAIFISVSRKDVIDIQSLFNKALNNKNFYVCIDIDIDEEVVETLPHIKNVMVTPHIAGSTLEARYRMFKEIAEQIVLNVNG